MTKTRVISAAIGLLGLIVVIWFGGYAGVAVTCFSVSAVALNEYGRMILESPRYRSARGYFIGLGIVDYLVSIWYNDWLLHSFVLTTLLLFIYFLLKARDESIPLEELVNKTGLSLLGILWAGICPVYISLLARLGPHLEWFIFTLAVVFTGDSVAYFAGRKFGRARLFGRISPKKSFEGAIAALFSSVIIGLGIRAFLLPHTDLFFMTVLCIGTSVVAQLGDLCESLIKRTFHTKDSGQIIPGHGGLLDRIDGVLFAAPLVYVFVTYLHMNVPH